MLSLFSVLAWDTGVVFLGKEVAVWFRADQESDGMAHRPIPSHFQPRITHVIRDL